MVRVLHLASGTPDFQTRQTAHAIARCAGEEFSITSRTIGRGGDYRHYLTALASLRLKDENSFDVIHAFDLPAIRATASTGKALISPSAILEKQALWRLASYAQSIPLVLTCGSETERRVCISNGLPAKCCHVVPPILPDFSTESSRTELRTALGFLPEDQVFLLPGESTRHAGHRDAMWAISILHVLHPSCRVLLWGHGDEIHSLDRLSKKLQQSGLLTIAEKKLNRAVKYEELLSAADVAVASPLGPIPLLPLRLCMAAGLPIVATDSPWLTDLLKEGHSAAVVRRHAPRLLAQRIMELRADPELAKRLADAAREDARRIFQANAAVAEYRALYRKIAAVPQPKH